MAFLPKEVFQTIIAATPLLSIDLVIQNTKGEYLVGLRTNRPAQNYWFVPGGRVQKNEKLDCAFKRLTRAELGLELGRESAEFMGVFEHLYDDSAFDETTSTHYVVLGYKLKLDIDLATLPNEQHNNYKWMSVDALLNSADVHLHTKWYVQ